MDLRRAQNGNIRLFLFQIEGISLSTRRSSWASVIEGPMP